MKVAGARPGTRKPDRRNQGAAMLAVMLILLLATATAAISVQATGFEMRASGHGRRATQGRLVSEAGLAATISRVDALGGASLAASFKELEKRNVVPFNVDNQNALDDGFNEPRCVFPGDNGCNRFSHYYTSATSTDFGPPAFEADKPPMKASDLGDNQNYQPWFAVDLRYAEDDPRPIPGFRAEGGGTMKFIHVDLVARGGTVYNADDGSRSARTIHTSCASLKLGPLMSF